MGDLEDVVNKTFFETVKNKFLEHYPKLVGLVGAGATYKILLEVGYFFTETNVFKADPFLLLGPAVSGYLSYKGINYYNRLRAYKKRFNLKSINHVLEEKPYKPKAPGLRRVLDIIFENPRAVGLATSILPAVSVYNLINHWMQNITYFNLIGDQPPQDLNTQYGVTLAFRALYIPLYYALGNIADRVLSALFHSENTKLTAQLFPAFFNHIIRRKDEYRKRVEEIVQTFPYPSAYHDLAAKQAEEGSFDQAFLTYIKGLRILKERGKLPYTTIDNWLSLNDNPQYLNIVWECEKELKKKPEPTTYLILTFAHLRLNNPDGAIDVLNDLSEEQGSLTPHTSVLKVEILDGVERKEEATKELKDLFAILKTPEYKKEIIGETTRDVYVFGPSEFIKGSLLFKESTYLNESEFEANLIHSLEHVIADYEQYKLPVQVANIFDYEEDTEKRFVYTERFVPSQNLLERFEQGDFSDLERVTDYLALIHSKLPEDVSKKGRLRLDFKLKNKLTDEDFSCSRELAITFIRNYHPVLNTFEDAICVFNKDAHPENWLIAEDGSIVAVDFQDKGIVPIQFDLVNLMEYGAFLGHEQKLKVLDDYINSYNHHKRARVIKDKERFRLTYFNAVVQRAISLSSAWSSPDRTTMWPKREVVIDNAINAIGIIKEEHNYYYKEYKENYDNLRDALIELKDLVSV